MYQYLKALHIIFIVTWFSGLFYMPRLFIYNTEAKDKPEQIKVALQEQFGIMMKRLWYGITWPSAIITLILGPWVMIYNQWHTVVFEEEGRWLLIKLIFVSGLYAYHFSLQKIVNQQLKGHFNYSSQQLRIWNEVATIFLVAIVILASVKQSLSFVWALIGLVFFIVLLLSAIRIYKLIRNKKN